MRTKQRAWLPPRDGGLVAVYFGRGHGWRRGTVRDRRRAARAARRSLPASVARWVVQWEDGSPASALNFDPARELRTCANGARKGDWIKAAYTPRTPGWGFAIPG